MMIMCLECASWDTNSYPSQVWANNTGPAVFKWRYRLSSNEEFVQINCGYMKKGVEKMVQLVQKKKNEPLQVVSSTGISSQVQVYTEASDSLLVGFRITAVSKSDPQVYICHLIYKDTGSGGYATLPSSLTLHVFGKNNSMDFIFRVYVHEFNQFGTVSLFFSA